MVNNIDADAVSWNPIGDSFVIEDIDEFSKVRHTGILCLTYQESNSNDIFGTN